MKKSLFLILIPLLSLSSLSCAGKKENAAAGSPGKLTQAVFATSLRKAGQEKKFVIIDFYTDWCKWCKVLEEKTYPAPTVKQVMDRSFILEKYNPEKATPVNFNGRKYTGSDVAQAFGVQGYPTIMFLDSEGEVIGSIPGFVPPEIFVKILAFVESGGYKSQRFDEFLNTL